MDASAHDFGAQKPLLLPHPRTLRAGLPFARPARIAPELSAVGPLTRVAETAFALMGAASATPIDPDAPFVLHCVHDVSLSGETYRLQLRADGGHLRAGTGQGVLRGMATLAQLLIQDGVAELDIEDVPALSLRGYMLDISRDRVPARRTLLHLLDALWLCKYNQLQLYTEHSFAFEGHETVWRDASPLRAADIRWLQDQCVARGIELVPNLNSLGHYGRWLRHPEYRHLSECPDGCTLPNGRVMPVGGTTLAPGPEALAFLDGLYAQYLPLFESAEFNAGLDEPWELGLGRSAAACAERGRQRVYLDHLRAVADLAAKYGKRLQFWADIVLEAPERVPELPREATGMIWGYEAGHPFAQQCAAFAQAGLPFVVCPGTTGWNSLAGRWQNARANIAEAVHSALRNGARGLLLTDWGDNGHHQPPVVSLPPLLHAAQLAWVRAELPDESLAAALDRVVLRDGAGVCGRALLDLGSLCERHFSLRIHNCAPVWKMLFGREGDLSALLPEADAAHLPAARAELAAIRARLANAAPKGFGGALVRAELELAADWLALGFDRHEGRVDAKTHAALCDRFEDLWLSRSERGGLPDSLRRLRRFDAEM